MCYYYYYSTELSGSSVMGALGGPGAGARGLVAGWAGQSGVLAPWGCDCGCSPQASCAVSSLMLSTCAWIPRVCCSAILL